MNLPKVNARAIANLAAVVRGLNTGIKCDVLSALEPGEGTASEIVERFPSIRAKSLRLKHRMVVSVLRVLNNSLEPAGLVSRRLEDRGTAAVFEVSVWRLTDRGKRMGLPLVATLRGTRGARGRALRIVFGGPGCRYPPSRSTQALQIKLLLALYGTSSTRSRTLAELKQLPGVGKLSSSNLRHLREAGLIGFESASLKQKGWSLVEVTKKRARRGPLNLNSRFSDQTMRSVLGVIARRPSDRHRISRLARGIHGPLGPNVVHQVVHDLEVLGLVRHRKFKSGTALSSVWMTPDGASFLRRTMYPLLRLADQDAHE